jgi:D-alanyl-D-alanine carboxypeptidase/D-alanyl-D-alanine-endopeptidase (penicillin-binding protein 4)
MIFKIFLILFLLSSCSENLRFRLELHDKKFDKEISYILYDVTNKKNVTSYKTDLALTPASVFKILTAYAALENFKYYHRFKTKVFYQGEMSRGVLYGDIVIQGGGDPSLDYDDLQNIVRIMRKKGIRRITGNLIYRNNYLLAASGINYAQPDGAIYNQGVSALSLRNNYVKINREDKGSYNLIPDINYLKFQKSKKYIQPKYNGNKIWKLKYKRNNLRLPIKDTSFYTASLIKKLMELNGIKVGDVIKRDKMNGRLILLFEYKGDRLADIVKYNLRYSHNLSSEILLLQVAKKLKCKAFTLPQAAGCLNRWYSKKFPELDWSNLEWENASGLSSKTKITTDHLIAVLKKFAKKSYGPNHSSSFFAVSALEGTLTKRLKDAPFNVWAKTGSMHFVSAMSGFLFSGENEYLFAIIANNKKKRVELDKIQEAKPGSRKHKKLISEAKEWKKSAWKEQEQFLRILLED